MKITPLITVDLGLENRDGKLFAVKALGLSQKHYLVLEADTYRREEEFIGMGSTLHVEITEQAFDALRLKQEKDAKGTNMRVDAYLGPEQESEFD